MKPRIQLVIFDLDNTLYDWVTYFARSFSAMTRVAAQLLECDHDRLLDDLRHVHQQHHNSEQPFALLETQIADERLGELSREERYEALRPAFQAFNSRRDQELRLYPGVRETLDRLHDRGALVVAHTEATVPNAMLRLRKLDVERYFSHLFAVTPSGQGHPIATRNAVFLAGHPTVRFLAQHERKPNPQVVRDIGESVGVPASSTVYVGDSIPRDIGMAKSAGAYAAWAKYGTQYSAEDWQSLVRVTHWTAADVARAEQARARYGNTTPDAVLEARMDELFEHFDIVRGTSEQRTR